MKVRYGQIALLLIGIVLLSLVVTAFVGVRYPVKSGGKLSVVASFYPMYTATLQVVGDSDGVVVTCLTQPTAGCLHDYQLSPSERIALEQADLLILNGAGAESFLEPVLDQLSARAVDTSTGLTEESHHDHGHDHDGHTHAVNEHLWISPTQYTQQVQAICDALCKADPINADTYRANTARYREQIAAVQGELTEIAAALPLDRAVLFHDSMAYLAEALALPVVGSLPIGEDQGFSAADVKAVADAVSGQAVLFLYDDQYDTQQEGLMAYAARSASVTLNSAVLPVKGVAAQDAWLYAMEHNLQALKEVAG